MRPTHLQPMRHRGLPSYSGALTYCDHAASAVTDSSTCAGCSGLIGLRLPHLTASGLGVSLTDCPLWVSGRLNAAAARTVPVKGGCGSVNPCGTGGTCRFGWHWRCCLGESGAGTPDQRGCRLCLVRPVSLVRLRSVSASSGPCIPQATTPTERRGTLKAGVVQRPGGPMIQHACLDPRRRQLALSTHWANRVIIHPQQPGLLCSRHHGAIHSGGGRFARRTTRFTGVPHRLRTAGWCSGRWEVRYQGSAPLLRAGTVPRRAPTNRPSRPRRYLPDEVHVDVLDGGEAERSSCPCSASWRRHFSGRPHPRQTIDAHQIQRRSSSGTPVPRRQGLAVVCVGLPQAGRPR